MYCLFLWFYFYFRDLFFITCWSSSESQTVCLWSHPSWSSCPLWFCNGGDEEKALWFTNYWKWQWSLCGLGCQSQSRFEMNVVLYFLIVISFFVLLRFSCQTTLTWNRMVLHYLILPYRLRCLLSAWNFAPWLLH